jgi:VanZ family protein
VSEPGRLASPTPALWRRRLWLWGPALAYAAASFGFSSLSAPPAPPQQLTDKHVHSLVFGGLALLLLRAWASGRWAKVTLRASGQVAVVAIAYGAIDEWHQWFVPGRHADLLDLVADALGIVSAVGLAYLVGRLFGRPGGSRGRIEQAAGRVGHTS